MPDMVKTPDELLKIMKAAAMGDICFSHILEFIRPGMTEIEVADEIERTLMDLGAEGLSFPTICVSGVNTTMPHGEPSEKVIEDGDFVTMDFGAIAEGYCGDMTRTIGIGHLSDEQKNVYDIVLKSQLTGRAACRAVVKCSAVDAASRNIIENAGYGDFYIHGTGHGVGTEVHEPPTLNAKSSEILEEFMPVTIEPGIYIPDKFGVRIEDLAIITEFGIINAVKSQKSLIII